MAKVLLTGGSGFVASHILNVLLERGYSVTTTVRSAAKGDKILQSYKVQDDKLSYVIIKDIAAEGAFDHALQASPPFDYVIHTASPFPANFADPVTDLLDPAIKGTTGILNAIKAYALSVKRVVITSSFAAMANGVSPPHIYDESSWNPVTWNEAVSDHSKSYRGSKTFAEKAAWEFVNHGDCLFDLVTLNPPLVYGPVIHHLENQGQSLASLNTSNQRIRDFIQGKYRFESLPPTGTFLWVDVRDLALAHVRALEVPEAGGKRFFATAGHCSNKRIVDAIRETRPDVSHLLPQNPVDDFPGDSCYGFDNSRSREILGIQFRSLEEGIGDTADSLLELIARSS
ncbi:SDR family oxidoreductase [Aspergillus stella-maris]|uniref:SDR family oxidoreductase n=1 Tax=Aspergillus stella-maris TaxID=1810926 RepID=UPI003CCD37E0